MMTLSAELQHELLERLMPLQPEKIILFGSYAYGEPHKDSDIDLLVVTDDEFMPRTFQENMQLRLKISNAMLDFRLHYATDLLVQTKPMHHRFIELDSAFAREILTKGVILYENDHRRLA